MIGTTAALIGMAIASSAASVAEAKIGANAATKAAGIQQQGASRAADALTNIWGQQQAALNPYIQQGQAASGLLGSLMRPPGTPGAYRPGMSFGVPPGGGGMVPGGVPPPPGGALPPPPPRNLGTLMGPRPVSY